MRSPHLYFMPSAVGCECSAGALQAARGRRVLCPGRTQGRGQVGASGVARAPVRNASEWRAGVRSGSGATPKLAPAQGCRGAVEKAFPPCASRQQHSVGTQPCLPALLPSPSRAPFSPRCPPHRYRLHSSKPEPNHKDVQATRDESSPSTTSLNCS